MNRSVYKKFLILGSVSQIFTNKVDFQNFRMIFDHISISLTKILEKDPEIENFLYIDKWINGKFSILGSSDQIFTNKVDFVTFAFVSKKSTFLVW